MDNVKKPLLLFFLILGSFLYPHSTFSQNGASLYLSPRVGSFFVGSTFNVSIFVNTGGTDINAVEASLRFPPNKLQIVQPTGGKSFISIWLTQPEFSNIEGTLNLSGGLPSPGINTSSGLVTTVTFRVKSPGRAIIDFDETSKVLKNDGRGTDILNSLIGGRYTLLVAPPEGPKVESLTHPDPNIWYNNNSPSFSWTKEERVDNFSYTLEQSSEIVPDNVSEGDQTVQEYTNIGDGIWYFHIKAHKTSWGGTTHFPVFIDTSPPASFTPQLSSRTITKTQRTIISFITTDRVSGLDHYELKIENLSDQNDGKTTPFFFEVSSPYRLPKLEMGNHVVTVRAYDRAGNFRDEEVPISVEEISLFRKTIFEYWWILIVLLVLLIGRLEFRESRKSIKEASNFISNAKSTLGSLKKELQLQLNELDTIAKQRPLTEEETKLRNKTIKNIEMCNQSLSNRVLEYNTMNQGIFLQRLIKLNEKIKGIIDRSLKAK